MGMAKVKHRSRKKSSPEFSPTAWAKASKRGKGGIRCQTCRNAETTAVIHEVLTIWASGEASGSIETLHAMLAAHYDYDLTSAALYKHVRRCEADLWERAK